MNGNRRIDVPALIFGALFLVIAAWWLTDRNFAVNVPNVGWLVAILLIAGGALGITRAIRAGTDRTAGRRVRGGRRPSDDDW